MGVEAEHREWKSYLGRFLVDEGLVFAVGRYGVDGFSGGFRSEGASADVGTGLDEMDGIDVGREFGDLFGVWTCAWGRLLRWGWGASTHVRATGLVAGHWAGERV